MHNNAYIERSLALNLFFGRIMKEHSFFLRAGFTPANPDFAKKAEYFQREFERLLSGATALSDGALNKTMLSSGEFVTQYTAAAEKQTECLTSIPIDRDITARQLRLCDGRPVQAAPDRMQIQRLNRTAMTLTDGLIAFKQCVLDNVLCGKMFTANYPLLIEHIIREAKTYRKQLEDLESGGDCAEDDASECFWNQIMMEHALFIRGMLDPTENELLCKADDFANEYCKLLERCGSAQRQALQSQSAEITTRFRDFKAAGVDGIENCKIRSVILPLLADHVLREANHFLRLLCK